MAGQKVVKSLVPWWVAGIMLGLVQVLAVWVADPLGVSTQFVTLDAKALNQLAPDYTQNHPLISQPKNHSLGYGFWLDVGMVVGGFVAAVAYRRWKLQTLPIWWKVNRGSSVAGRFLVGFI
ncbi:MAG: YeeE/YedE thiosulfate transporter family protein, partial [Anaerohalosphaeraceae bacterium]